MHVLFGDIIQASKSSEHCRLRAYTEELRMHAVGMCRAMPRLCERRVLL